MARRDEQDVAESLDDEIVGTSPVTSDEADIDFPPDRPVGIPYADADVSDESVAERARRGQPEVWEQEFGFDGDAVAIEGLPLDETRGGDQVIVADPFDESAEEAALHIEEAGEDDGPDVDLDEGGDGKTDERMGDEGVDDPADDDETARTMRAADIANGERPQT